jgi:hypothetical protein
MPPRVAALPIDPQRGVPVSWFVHWLEDGKPEFRIIGPDKFNDAVRFSLCWVCGQQRGRWGSFVLGPMCTVTRTTSEPACHLECAVYAATTCPFLVKPHMRRRDISEEYPDAASPGLAIKRNPGVAAVWTTRDFKLFPDPQGRALIEVGEPSEVLWFAEGRPATRAECLASIESGYPILDAECDKDKDPVDSRRVLAEMKRAAEVHLPKPGDTDAAQGMEKAREPT